MGNVASVLASNSVSLGLSICFPLGVGACIAQQTKKEITTWYQKLKKPSWNPPAWLFGPVWSALYAMMGVASWMVWKQAGFKGDGAIALSLYAVQLVCNFAWTPLFFAKHRLDIALADSVALLGSAAATTAAFARIDPVAGALISPLVAWVSFATALNAWLLRNNPNADKIGYVIEKDEGRAVEGPTATGAAAEMPAVAEESKKKEL